ncbi:MAG TPA: Calx-beta domain-containing protein, partial [Syntrophomonadaceae bacterium]|nr:Calx-beta domain-containing protein [Syntrophomonadaceae bacterium]
MNIVKKALPLILLTLIIILVMQPVTVWADMSWQSQIDVLDEPVIISKWGSELRIDEDLYIHKNVELQCDYSIVLSDAYRKKIAAGKTLTLKTNGGPFGLVLLSNVTAEGPDATVIIDTSSSDGAGGDVYLGFFNDSGGDYPSLIINCSGGNGEDGKIYYNSSLQFSSAAYTVNDGDTAAITVSRTISDVGKVRVQYSTSDGTAQAGTDYTPVSGVLEFANGESQKTFYVSTNDISGTSRTVNLILSNPDAWATLGDQTTAVLTIEDNDPVCEIGTTPYSTLDEALSAVAAGETKTIKLLADIEYTGGIVITGKTVTFDLNGHTLKVTNDGGHGLEVGSGGVVNLDTSKGGSFNVTASGSAKYAIYAHDGGQATVTSATASGSGSRAVYAHDGGQVTVTSATLTSGDMNSRGAMASGAGSFIWVTGNITAGSGYGAFAENGGSIEVGGNVTGGSCGVYAMGSGSVITIAGNAEATISDYYNSGARADDGAAVTVGGNVISKAGRSAYTYGEGSLLIIEGAVSTDYGGGAGAEAKDNSTIIIKGTITAPNYLRLDGEAKAASEWTNVDAGYKIYNNGISIIKVKNNPPAAKSPVPTQSVTAGSTAAFCASDIAVDIEEDSLIITAIVTGPEAAKATASLNSGTVTLTGVAVGDTSVVVTVSDGTDTVNIAVPVSVSPAPPTLVTSITVKGADDATTVANGGTLQMIAEVEPANATDKTVTWSVFPGTGTATIDPSTGLLTGTGEGTVTVRATANDGSGVYGEKVITVTEALPGNTPPNRKPGIPPTATASAAVNTAYTLDLSTIFEDADGDLLTYKVSVNGGAYVAADRVYSYTPTVTGTTTLVFKAHD